MSKSSSLQVLMFGWEFPPFNSGGLGVACRGIVSHFPQDVDVTLVLPRVPDEDYSGVNFLEINSQNPNAKVRHIDSFLTSYTTKENYRRTFEKKHPSSSRQGSDNPMYGQDLFAEVNRYARLAREIASQEEFDVIHVHDWLTFLAGIAAKKVSNKPLVAHIHATEFDRAAGHGINDKTYQIEQRGLNAADKVIAVSDFTKNTLVEKYDTNQDKIRVVHNGIDSSRFNYEELNDIKLQQKDVVLFLGRITLQKYPTGFIAAAQKVLKHREDTIFIMAGDGELKEEMVQQAAERRIADKVLFPGFVDGKDISKLYQAADMFVMPSVSEPFGLTALEAMIHGTPTLVSKQSGVSEIISHGLKADFWDIEAIADKIISVLEYEELQRRLAVKGKQEASSQTWHTVAQNCHNFYHQLL